MRSVDPLGQTLRIFGGKERGEISSSFRNTGSRGCWIVRREIGKRGSDFLFVASFLFICFFILLFSICMHGFWNGNFLAITERLYFEIQKKIRNGRIVYFFFFFFIYVPKWKELILAEALRLECPVSQAIIILKFMKHSDIISVLRHAIKNEFKYA